ncbi:alpha-amylase family glycosyl hydrolase [Spirosoma daeguense]
MKTTHLAVVLSVLLLATACRDKDKTKTEATSADSATKAPPAPDWAKNATIYEINPRQFSTQGTFKAIETQLPRLKELGVDIIWLMPIFPISQVNKQGTLGNPYAITNYTTVNPDYGTLADFKLLVSRAHALGLRVILDWVPSYTGHDHVWVEQHPDWYLKLNGKVTAPIDERTGKPYKQADIIALDYTKPELRKGMIEAMQYWLKECDIDGFRCTVASMVPNDFWASLRPELDKIKPVFMLAEWEDDPNQFKSGFNMNYAWSMHNMMKAVAKGARTADKIDSVREANQKRFPMWYYQMMFTQNHDENTKNGTLTELFGPAADAMIVLSSTLEGMPMIYNGMESNLSKRLAVFDKDTIAWGNYAKSGFFKTLLTLKHRNKALWNGLDGGMATKIGTDHDDKIYAFYRHRDNDRVVVLLNLSSEPLTAHLSGDSYTGMYTDVFSHQPVELRPDMSVTLKPWEYRVLTN